MKFLCFMIDFLDILFSFKKKKRKFLIVEVLKWVFKMIVN